MRTAVAYDDLEIEFRLGADIKLSDGQGGSLMALSTGHAPAWDN